MQIDISIIVAIFNRQEELLELLKSLENQVDKNFEVVIVDDGSVEDLKPVVELFYSKLNLKYCYKTNSGPGLSRNFGTKKASGNYFIFLDSDCIIPEKYISIVRENLEKKYHNFFGGPDAADVSFGNLQKAITFSMTSLLTTGGIRGKSEKMGKFQPRSFNMGISRVAFEKVGGFSEMRIGEDPDLTMTLWENGFDSVLISEAFVFHKRRTSLKKFIKQVYQFGIARPILNQRHPKFAKVTFWFPSIFSLGVFLLILFSIIVPKVIFLLFFYILLVFVMSFLEYKSLIVSGLSIITTFLQFFAYGSGFMISQFKLNILKQNPTIAFPSHFYKTQNKKIQ